MATQMDWADAIIFVLGYASGAFVATAAALATRKDDWDPPPVDEVLCYCRHRRIQQLRKRVERLGAASRTRHMVKAEKKLAEKTETLRNMTDKILPDGGASKPAHPDETWSNFISDTPVEFNDGRLEPMDAEMMWTAYDQKSRSQRVPPRIRTPYSGTFPINIVDADGGLLAQRVKFGWDIRIHHEVPTRIVFKVKCGIGHKEAPREVTSTVPESKISTLLDGRKQHEQREMLCRLCSQEMEGKITVLPVDKPHPNDLSWHPPGSVFEFQRRRLRMTDMKIVPKMDLISFVYEFDAISSKKGRIHVRYDTENKGSIDWQGGVGCADVNLTIRADKETDEWKMDYSVILSILFMSGDKERLSNMIIWTERAYNVIEEFGNLSPIEISD